MHSFFLPVYFFTGRPADCFFYRDKDSAPIHLRSIAEINNDVNLLKLTALFRFIDGLDINQNRVGDNTEKNIKKQTIERDLKYQILKLKREVSTICETRLNESGLEKRFFTLFYDKVAKSIEKEKYVDKELKKEQDRFLDRLRMKLNLENYYMLSEYIEFLAVQDGHFGLHNSINTLEIETLPPCSGSKGKLRFKIQYKTRKSETYLADKNQVEVKERGEAEGLCIRDHLLGKLDEKKTEFRKKDGYVRRELNNCREYLNDWFDLDNTEIWLCASDNEIKEKKKENG